MVANRFTKWCFFENLVREALPLLQHEMLSTLCTPVSVLITNKDESAARRDMGRGARGRAQFSTSIALTVYNIRFTVTQSQKRWRCGNNVMELSKRIMLTERALLTTTLTYLNLLHNHLRQLDQIPKAAPLATVVLALFHLPRFTYCITKPSSNLLRSILPRTSRSETTKLLADRSCFIKGFGLMTSAASLKRYRVTQDQTSQIDPTKRGNVTPGANRNCLTRCFITFSCVMSSTAQVGSSHLVRPDVTVSISSYEL
ncbi:hypothetical protein J6590_027477 [Homalodisca vitripennis]|nr:hypothetical protein J6590_027477 [Homalodisca vitripennis]